MTTLDRIRAHWAILNPPPRMALCVYCNRSLPPWAFEPAAAEFPTRSGRVYTCIDCNEARPTTRWRRLPNGRVEVV